MACIRRVIVGVSGSPGSIAALRYAANLTGGSRSALLAVHAWVPPGGDLAERRQPCPPLRRVWEKAARERLAGALEAAWGPGNSGLNVEPVVLRGAPGQILVELACTAADLLVVGAGRRGALARIGHGRVGRYCQAHAQCPVLAIPPPALAQAARNGLRRWAFRHRELTLDRALREWGSAALDQGRR